MLPHTLTTRLALRAVVDGLALLFEVTRRLDRRFARAIANLSATYELQAGTAARQLVIRQGRARARAAGHARPDYRVTFVDLPGALGRLSRRPNDVLRLQLENQIQPAGNVHHLFQLGYLLGLARHALKARLPRRLVG